MFGADPVQRRPQEPLPPFPYEEERVCYENRAARVTLAGTLTKPRTEGPHPAALLITGSGPHDRNETVLGHRPFLVLADHLTRHGIAVLRSDDRGVGKSSGDFASAAADDFAGDARAAFDFLTGRSDVRADSIGLLGHSDGGAIAPMVAADSPDVAWIAMLPGPAISFCSSRTTWSARRWASPKTFAPRRRSSTGRSTPSSGARPTTPARSGRSSA